MSVVVLGEVELISTNEHGLLGLGFRGHLLLWVICDLGVQCSNNFQHKGGQDGEGGEGPKGREKDGVET